MLWEKTSNKIIIVAVFVAAFLVTRIPRLDSDVVNPDAVNWHYRSQQFINGLKYKQFEKTYQHYHPGVTLMWVTAVPVEIYKQVSGIKQYTHLNFSTFDLIAKVGLVTVQVFLTLAALYLLNKLFSFKRAFLIVSVFSFEIFFLGNSRLYHMDVLYALLLFDGLLLAFLALERKSVRVSALAGVFLAFCLLTRSVGISAVLYVLVFYIVCFLARKKDSSVIKLAVAFLVAALAATFLAFPALWVNPVYYIKEIFSQSARIGLREGHAQTILGETTQSAGLGFYLLVLLVKSTPIMIAGLSLYLIKFFAQFKKSTKETVFNRGSVTLFLSLYYLAYFLFMSLVAKKLDRYIITIFPWLSIFAVEGLCFLYEKLCSRKVLRALVIVFFALVSYLFPLYSFYPFYFVYTSPIFGSSALAGTVIAQKPFGVGIYDLKERIIQEYGEVRLGFIDTKPMKSIYPGSKVFDIRISGSDDYDLLVLGINENFPSNMNDTKNKFELKDTVKIVGLDYWRIYVKK